MLLAICAKARKNRNENLEKGKLLCKQMILMGLSSGGDFEFNSPPQAWKPRTAVRELSFSCCILGQSASLDIVPKWYSSRSPACSRVVLARRR